MRIVGQRLAPPLVLAKGMTGSVEKIFISFMYNKGTWRVTGKTKSKLESLKLGNMVTDGKIKIDD